MTKHEVDINGSRGTGFTVRCMCRQFDATAPTIAMARRIAHAHLAFPDREADLVVAEVAL